MKGECLKALVGRRDWCLRTGGLTKDRRIRFILLKEKTGRRGGGQTLLLQLLATEIKKTQQGCGINSGSNDGRGGVRKWS